MPELDKFEQLRYYYAQILPGMPDHAWEFTRSLLTVRSIPKNHYILREGSVCNHVSFVNSGLVKMGYMAGDKEKVISFCDKGNYISDYQSFLTRKPSMMYLQALEDTELVETTFDGLQSLYKQVPEANLLGRLIAEQLFIMMTECDMEEKTLSIESRYQKLIQEQPSLLQRVPQYMIASYLGITPEAFSRIKGRLQKQKAAA
jgi:CRP/FNR family transcriptional regulator, anaerobic regulatory protein